jgi:diaminohydroxyphosphoribosylaminopyrimidine deaminase/5-amino-6-(5-phosphoribosylamino)uracil reductase
LSQRNFNLMQRAFAEAAHSDWLFTAPNPLVGALALENGHVVGYGHHAQFGQAHAEEMALLGNPSADELYVSLEPCSSSGASKKRPACCVDIILKSQVKKVVVGALDPDARHAGSGIEKLRAQGIEVTLLECDEQFTAQNPAFLRHLKRAVPFTIVKWAASADGFIAASSGESQWISNEKSRAEVHRLRGASQAIAAGGGTVAVDDPRLTARNVEHNILNCKVLIACADKVSSEHKLLADDLQRLWFDTGEQNHPWATSNDVFSVCANQESRVDLSIVWKQLRETHHLNRVFVEGGARLVNTLIKEGLVHAIVKYEAPILLGGGLSAIAADGFESPQQALRLSHELRCDHEQDLRRAWLVD